MAKKMQLKKKCNPNKACLWAASLYFLRQTFYSDRLKKFLLRNKRGGRENKNLKSENGERGRDSDLIYSSGFHLPFQDP